MAAKLKKKGEVGKKAAFVSRTKALRTLQIGLKEFRTLCIYKGIYPQISGTKAKYHKKDIAFLSHDPTINYFRQLKAFKGKLKKHVFNQDKTKVAAAKFTRPKLQLDHIIKERYPTFDGALADLNDALNLLFLFSKLPQLREIRRDIVRNCKLRTAEFLHYVIMSGSLRKTFVSVKGIYYQAEIAGQNIVWMVPHPNFIEIPSDSDTGVMVNFAEIYLKLLEFVNFKLFKDLHVPYPLKLKMGNANQKLSSGGKMNQEDSYLEILSGLNTDCRGSPSLQDRIKHSKDSEKIEVSQEFAHLIDQSNQSEMATFFIGKKFYLSREVNKQSLIFLIRAFGGTVSCDDPYMWGGFNEDDKEIDYHIIDRDQVQKYYPSRFYVQPQWVFDCVNSKTILPTNKYVPGCKLPPHLSPFDETYKAAMEEVNQDSVLSAAATGEMLELQSSSDEVEEAPKDKKRDRRTPLTGPERKLALMKMNKKKRKIYDAASSKLARVEAKKNKIKRKHLLIKNYSDGTA